MFTGKNNTKAIESKTIRHRIRYEPIRKKRFLKSQNLFYFVFCEPMEFRYHRNIRVLFSNRFRILSISHRIVHTEMLGRSWIGDNTSGSSCHDVEFGFTTDIFITIWIRHSELMTTLSATCSKDLASPNGE